MEPSSLKDTLETFATVPDEVLLEAWKWPEYEPLSPADTAPQLRDFLIRLHDSIEGAKSPVLPN